MSVTLTASSQTHIDLSQHERCGGHTLSNHVAKTDFWLRQRLVSDPAIPLASSFPDSATAETAVNAAVQANLSGLNAWLGSTRAQDRFDHDVGTTIGVGFHRRLPPYIVGPITLTKVRVIVKKASGATPTPFLVLSAFCIL